MQSGKTIDGTIQGMKGGIATLANPLSVFGASSTVLCVIAFVVIYRMHKNGVLYRMSVLTTDDGGTKDFAFVILCMSGGRYKIA